MSTTAIAAPMPGWLRNPAFDSTFIFGIAAVAILSGAIVVMEPRLFLPILFLDLWLLGYHHVVSTFTRLCFDKKSFQENKFFLVWLPFICLGAVAILAKGIGVWTIATIYLYWQWFHYTRQSWGISQAYRRNESDLITDDMRWSKAVFYCLPVTGILYRMHQGSDVFLGLPVYTPPIPGFVVAIAGIATAAILTVWAWTRIKAHIEGRLPIAHTAYMVSHMAIFFIGYIFITDITYGWLVINIWHNAQYVMFVWLYNNKKHGGENADTSPLLRFMSKTENWPKYLLICLTISTAAYILFQLGEPFFAVVGLAPMIILYQTINFHHYIVDGYIWKSRKTKVLARNQAA